MNVAALVLAAGSSSRMGRPKQLLEYQGRPLLRCAAETALEANLSPVIVVLGASAEDVRGSLAGLSVHILENPEWARGMGTTLRMGIGHLPREVEAVILLLCDQPLVTAAHLAVLVAEEQRSGKPLVAAAYNETVGVPALVGRKYFAELQTLPNAAGAKAIFGRHPDDVATVPIPEAAIDIDDPAAYTQLTRRTL